MAKIQYEKDIKIDEKQASVDIDIKVSPEEYAKVWEKAAERMAQHVTMPGFRKGKVPISAVKSSKANEISENAFNDMVNTIVQEIMGEIPQKPVSTVRIMVKEHEHEGHNEESEHNHNIEFLLSFAYRIAPKLPNIEDLKVAKPANEVSDEEINKSMEMLMKSINEAPPREGETLESKQEKEIIEWTDENVGILNIPEVNTVENLKELIRAEVEKQKQYDTEMQYRAQILDEIVKNSELIIPKYLLEDMVMQQERDYQDRIQKLGFDYESYIKEKNINLDELKKEWETMIHNDLARELILTEYVQKEGIKATEEEIDQAIKSADTQLKEKYTDEGLRQYMDYVISNNKGFSKIYGIVSKE